MDLSDLPPVIQHLPALDDATWDIADWLDYHALGIGHKDIPVLMDILHHTREYWEDVVEAGDPMEWIPVHAWRALGQLKAVEALPALFALLPLIEEEDSDLVQEDLASVFAAIGPETMPDLTAYLKDPANEMMARLVTAEGLMKIAQQYPETRAQVVNTLSGMLADAANADPTFNGFLVLYLSYLKAVEAAPLIEQAYQDGRVDESILGDWEDFQVAVGLLEQRQTPRTRFMPPPSSFNDGLADSERVTRAREDEKTKQKAKQAKLSRKKNRKVKSRKKKKH